MSFGQAVRTGFSGAFTWSGRSSRAAFWWFYLFAFLFLAVVQVLGSILSGQSQSLSVVAAVLVGLAVLLVIVPFLGVTVRRLHDQGKSGWWYWVSVVPFIGPIWLLVLMVMQGTAGPNRYGNAPDDWVVGVS